MKKLLILLIALVLSLQIFGFNSLSKAVSVAPPFNVDVDPINAGVIAHYRIYGSYSDYDRVGILKLYFRDDTRFKFDAAPFGSILVNGNPVQGAQFKLVTSDNSVELTLYLSKLLYKNDPVEILIKKEAGLVNPITPATCYKVRVVYLNPNGVELGWNLSNSYRITVSSVQNVEVNVDPPVKGMSASYDVKFLTGARGALQEGSGEIRIRFPAGTIIPSYLSKSYVKVNGVEASSVYRSSDDPYVLRVYASFDIPSYHPVFIEFSQKFGIKNPPSGMKVLSVSTSVEDTWVDSLPFEIFDPQVQNLSITLSKDFIGGEAGLTITFATSPVGALDKGKNIYINFDNNFKVTRQDMSNLIYVNGIVSNATVNGNTLVIESPVLISSSDKVEISIKEDAGIINPSIPGTYSISVWTDTDSFKVTSEITIRESSVSEVKFEPLYSGINLLNEFKITFKTGPVMTLSKGVDYISITFDKEFIFTTDKPPKEAFTVNGLVADSASLSNGVLTIYVPQDIGPDSYVEVKISVDAGIKNPSLLGRFGITLYTSKEPNQVASNKVEFISLPVVEFSINPSSPDGMNGIYRTSPEITLSTSNGLKVFYKVDDEEFKEFQKPFKVGEGGHSVFAYAVDARGNKGKIVEKKIVVDTTPPVINVDNLSSGFVVLGSSKVVSGSVSEPCTLKITWGINEKILELSDNLKFSFSLDVKDGDSVAIWARDLAGNQTTLLLTAKIDREPPTISFVDLPLKALSGNDEFETTDNNFTLKILLNEKGRVFVNGNEIFQNNATYVYSLNLTEGDNVFTIEAYDLAGNKSMKTLIVRKVNEKIIKLQIGSKEVVTSTGRVTLDQSPFVEKGVTLVPLRFIAETFGATVNYNDALKLVTIEFKDKTIQVQINSNIALVNNQIDKLEVSPKIIGGLTFVPLRFITEAFGATVDWDGTTKTITITYKP